MTWFEQLIQQAPEVLLHYGTRVLGAVLAIFIALAVAGWVRAIVRRSLEKKSFDTTLTRFFANGARWVVLIAAGIGILGLFGIETTAFAAVLGAAGLAIGLAFQGTLGNFASGVMLLVFRPFKIGDYIVAAGQAGTVGEIELFTTELTTPDNQRVIVPNGKLFGDVIVNVNHHPKRRVSIPVGVDYGADIDQVRKALEGCIANIEGRIDDPAPQVFLKELADSSVNWEVRVWANTADFWTVHENAVRAIKQALDNAKIGIPFPQLDVHLLKENT